MKILALVYNATDSCSFYRAGGIFPDLRRKMDVDIHLAQWNSIEIHWQKIIEYDLVFMQRPFNNEAVSFAHYLKNFNVPLWVDYDDNLFAVPVENKFSKLYDDAVRNNIREIMKAADVVSVTTEDLKSVCEEYSGNVKVIPNAFNDYIFTSRKLFGSPEKIAVWRGTDSHIFDIMTVGDAINKITGEADDWKYYFVGFHPWYLEERKNVFNIPEMDVIFYFRRLQRMQIGVLYAPLHDSIFNRCKSNIAWIEAMYFGGVCIAPDFPEWRRPGALNYTSVESFYEIFRAVKAGEVNIKAECEKGWEYIADNLLLSHVNKLREELIKSLI